MKKLGMFALAFALVLGLTQCKKENTAASNDEGAKVPITLNVNDSSSRVAVEGSTGVVTFESGDVIHVVSNGTYVGTLAYDGTNFSGEVTEPIEGEKLQFYFLGNKTPEFNSDNTGCSVVISDQTEYLPVVSYAPSRENYQVGLTAYNATLLNKCALVKFDVTTASEAATCIVVMNNKVTVDFTDNSFAYGQDGEGVITLAAGNGEKWAILLPQEEVTYTDAYSTDGIYNGSCATIPSIEENDYLTNGIAVVISHPIGAIEGMFTVNTNGDQVYFSQGNLQYQASTNIWRFAENQWDYVGTQTPDYYGNVGGTVNGSDNNNISSTYDGWIDLFNWGTSGYNHGASCYQPWSTNRNYYNYYAYGQSNYNLYDGKGQADWGYNAISNGNDTENQWRTLTDFEWNHIFNVRTTTSGIYYAKANVNSVNGVILLPDDWSSSTYSLNSPNTSEASFSSNTITATQWTALESAGAVFLPAAGNRWGTSTCDVGSLGNYWSASYNDSHFACNMKFNSDDLVTHYYFRDSGFSVRLVRSAE